MTDIHSHALPKIDDGAKDVSQSIEMLKRSFNQNVKTCVLTPHCVIHSESAIDDFLARRAKSYELILPFAQKCLNIPRLVLGAEVYCDHDISRHADIKKLCFENTDLLLSEFPLSDRKIHFSDWIYSLNCKGITVIAAHVERYSNSVEIIEETKDLNVIYQINAESLLRFNSRRKVGKILKCRGKFVVASDMHNMSLRRSQMDEAFAFCEKRGFADIFANDDFLKNGG